MDRHFDNWDYQAVQELERLCLTLPVLPRDRAAAFFSAASKTTGDDGEPVERHSGNLFDSLMGFVSASDQKDFSATWELETQNMVHGVLMVETFDRVIGMLFCVARISENAFLTKGFLQSKKEAVKRLRTAPASGANPQDTSKPEGKKWWKLWR